MRCIFDHRLNVFWVITTCFGSCIGSSEMNVNTRWEWDLKQRGLVYRLTCILHCVQVAVITIYLQGEKKGIMNWFVQNTKVSVFLEKWSFIFLDVTHLNICTFSFSLPFFLPQRKLWESLLTGKQDNICSYPKWYFISAFFCSALRLKCN